MKTSLPLFAILAAATTTTACAQDTPYEFYDPEITNGLVVDTANNPYGKQYNHDSSIAFFDGKWVAVWNTGDDREGHAEQWNVMAVSDDAINWSAPEIAFSDPAHSTNPVLGDPLEETVQWQPNLLTVGDQLWCTWSVLDFLQGQKGLDRLASRGVYFSYLDSIDGKWTNRLLRWEVDPANGRAVSRPDTAGPETTPVNGRDTLIFPSQNPIQLKSGAHAGRVLAPITTRSRFANPGIRENGVIYTDDGGVTWRMSEPILFDQSPLLWEPTVYEIGPDHVAMIARCRNTATIASPAEILTFCESFDGGITWTDNEWIPVETISSRMHVVSANERHIMIYNDHRHQDNAGDRDSDRVNMALYFSRSGQVADWLPANAVSRPNQYGVSYPQMEARDNKLTIIYSDGFSRSLRTAVVDPIPAADVNYIYPRSLQLPRPEVQDNSIFFEFEQYLDTRWTNRVGEGDFSLAARLITKHGGALVDTLSEDGTEGFLFYFYRTKENWHIHYPALYIPGVGNFICEEGVPAEREVYVGVSVFNGDSVRFTVNENNRRSHLTGYEFPLESAADLSSGVPARIGVKRTPKFGQTRSIKNFRGEIIDLRLYDAALTLDQHQRLRRGLSLHTEPVVHLDAARIYSDAFELPAFQGVAATDDPNIKRIVGQGSASLEADTADLTALESVAYSFEFRALTPEADLVLATLGDAMRPLRVVLQSDGQIVARHDDQEVPIARYGGDWIRLTATIDLAGQGVTLRLGDAETRLGDAETRLEGAFNLRAYIGQGYLQDTLEGLDSFEFKIDTAASQVWKK